MVEQDSLMVAEVVEEMVDAGLISSWFQKEL